MPSSSISAENVPCAVVEMVGTSHKPSSRASTRRSSRSSSSKKSSSSGAHGWSSSNPSPGPSCAAAPKAQEEHRTSTAKRPADHGSISHLLHVRVDEDVYWWLDRRRKFGR